MSAMWHKLGLVDAHGTRVVWEQHRHESSRFYVNDERFRRAVAGSLGQEGRGRGGTCTDTTDHCMGSSAAHLHMKAATRLLERVVQRWPPGECGSATVASGDAGIALTLFLFASKYSPEWFHRSGLRSVCVQYIDAAVEDSKRAAQRHSMYHGRIGIYVVAAVVYAKFADRSGDRVLSHRYVRKALALVPKAVRLATIDDEVLYGRAGTLMALHFLSEHSHLLQLGAALHQTLDEHVHTLFRQIIANGVALGAAHGKPDGVLHYIWHDRDYAGLGHGVAGILCALMRFEAYFGDTFAVPTRGGERFSLTARILIERTLDSLLEVSRAVPSDANSSGNGADSAGVAEFPSRLVNGRVKLVQWCHGPAALVTLCLRARELWPSRAKELTETARLACNVIWQRGVLCKGPLGLCHSVAGNGMFLLKMSACYGSIGVIDTAADALYCSRYARRASAFADVAVVQLDELAFPDVDEPHCLLTGACGTVCFLAAAASGLPCFPGFQI